MLEGEEGGRSFKSWRRGTHGEEWDWCRREKRRQLTWLLGEEATVTAAAEGVGCRTGIRTTDSSASHGRAGGGGEDEVGRTEAGATSQDRGVVPRLRERCRGSSARRGSVCRMAQTRDGGPKAAMVVVVADATGCAWVGGREGGPSGRGRERREARPSWRRRWTGSVCVYEVRIRTTMYVRRKYCMYFVHS